MRQLIFDLPQAASLGRADFFVSTGNAAAAGWIDRWPAWPSATLLLHGPPGCGKTHLLHLWRARAVAELVPGTSLNDARLGQLLGCSGRRIAIDDADRAEATALLHLVNACHQDHGSLLLTARSSPASWPTTLPDLGSRLRAALSVAIQPPDDALLAAVLTKHFADRQVLVASEIIAYLSRHMDRSLAEAAAIAAALDAAALGAGSAITVPLARQVLAEQAAQSSPSGNDRTTT
jgi:chromosomal replication initiation ATPase DnaA